MNYNLNFQSSYLINWDTNSKLDSISRNAYKLSAFKCRHWVWLGGISSCVQCVVKFRNFVHYVNCPLSNGLFAILSGCFRNCDKRTVSRVTR
jgi:hypothetical protein